MFYVYKGELWISAAARLYPEVIELERECKSDLYACVRYLRYCYVRRDNEDYWSMPPMERGRHVVRSMMLWACNRDTPDSEVDSKIEKIESRESIKGMIALFRKVLMNDKGRLIEDLRRKVEVLRERYMKEDDDEAMQAIFKSIEQATKLLDSAYQMEGEDSVRSATVEYLFEVPEDKKSFDLRII
jgi:hypothetical protein